VIRGTSHSGCVTALPVVGGDDAVDLDHFVRKGRARIWL